MRLSPWALSCLIVLAYPHGASAQCSGNASSCVHCHEVQGARAVLRSAHPWHVDHGFGDLCASCHGGVPTAPSREDAHAGLRCPLRDPAVSCGGCHTRDLGPRVERYRLAFSTLRAPAPVVTPPAPPGPAPPHPQAGRHTANRAFALLAALLALAIARVLRGGTSPPRAPRVTLTAWLRAPQWSPHHAGALLGLTVAFSMVFCGRTLAASAAFDRLAAYPGRALFPSSQFYGHIMAPGITWQVWLMVGLLLGSWASSRASGLARWRWLPDTQWAERFGPGRALRLALAFLGAALVQLGAGIAGGCTSGLAISGGAVLAPAAFLFMAGMFAGGIPVAWALYRGRSAS